MAKNEISRPQLYKLIVNVRANRTANYRGHQIVLTRDRLNVGADIEGAIDRKLWSDIGASSRLQLLRDIDQVIDILDELDRANAPKARRQKA